MKEKMLWPSVTFIRSVRTTPLFLISLFKCLEKFLPVIFILLFILLPPYKIGHPAKGKGVTDFATLAPNIFSVDRF